MIVDKRRIILFIFLFSYALAARSRINPLMYHLLPIPPESYDHSKRKSSYPYISGDTFRAICDHHIDETNRPFDPKNVAMGDIIFVRALPGCLDTFVKNLPHIQNQFILITHRSDYTMPGDYAFLLNDDRIIAWFAENKGILNHPKLFPIPIGLSDPHTPHGKIEIITEAIAATRNVAKKHLLYVNFEPSTNSKVRNSIFQHFSKLSFSYLAERKVWGEYLKELAYSKFVLSPPGNGMDCHRTWEALLMGSIPVIKSTSIDYLFDDLPVVIVQDWSEVTQKFLEKKYANMRRKTYNFNKLYADYWLNQIRAIQARIRQQ